MRQRLLENQTLTLNQAKALDFARRNTESYNYSSTMPAMSYPNPYTPEIYKQDSNNTVNTAATTKSSRYKTCWFYAVSMHPRNICPAKEPTCSNCFKKV